MKIRVFYPFQNYLYTIIIYTYFQKKLVGSLSPTSVIAMIRVIGVITNSGIPVSILRLTSVGDDSVIASLISAVRALSEVFGKETIKQVDFGEDKLLLKDTKKDYIIFALVTKAEKFFERLLILLAEEIDRSREIEPAGGFVDDILGKKVEAVLLKYVEPAIPLSITDILVNMWIPLLDGLSSDPRLRLGIEEIKRILKKAKKKESMSWKKFIKDIKKISRRKTPVEYALEGNFSLAYIFSRDYKELIGRIFCLKMGILARLIINRPAPPIEELDKIAASIPNSNIYAKLVKTELEYIKRRKTYIELMEIYEKAAKAFRPGTDDKSLMLAFLFVSPFIDSFKNFAAKLARFFYGKSSVIYSYLVTLLERQNILEKIYAIASYDEIRPHLLAWKERIREQLIKLNDILNKRTVASDGEILLVTMPNIVTYQMLLMTLIESPVLTLQEKLSFVTFCLDTYYKFIRKIIRRNLPIFVTTLVDLLQVISNILRILYPTLTRDKLVEDFVERARIILQDTLEAMLNNLSKFRPYLENVLAVISNIVTCLVEFNIRIPEELEAIYVILNELSISDVESWKFIQPYRLMRLLGDLLETIISMAIRYIEDEPKKKIIIRSLKDLIKTYKWLMTQGRISRENAYNLATYLLRTYKLLSKEEFKEMVNFVDRYIHVLVPNIKEGKFELAMICRPLIKLFELAYKELGYRKYLELGREILETSKSVLLSAGLTAKFRELENEFQILNS